MENLMKLKMAFLGTAALAANELMARVLVQGVEPALVSAALHWWIRNMSAARALFSNRT